MATISMPVEIELCGRRLKRNKSVTVSNGRKKETMNEVLDFWASVTVIKVSEERQSKFDGLYRSVQVKFQNGLSGHVIGYGSIRDKLARLVPGQKYNFEGYEQKGASLMLNCLAIVTGDLKILPNGEVR